MTTRVSAFLEFVGWGLLKGLGALTLLFLVMAVFKDSEHVFPAFFASIWGHFQAFLVLVILMTVANCSGKEWREFKRKNQKDPLKDKLREMMK